MPLIVACSAACARKYMLNHSWLNLEWRSETEWVWMGNIKGLLERRLSQRAVQKPKPGEGCLFYLECFGSQPLWHFLNILLDLVWDFSFYVFPHLVGHSDENWALTWNLECQHSSSSLPFPQKDQKEREPGNERTKLDTWRDRKDNQKRSTGTGG